MRNSCTLRYRIPCHAKIVTRNLSRLFVPGSVWLGRHFGTSKHKVMVWGAWIPCSHQGLQVPSAGLPVCSREDSISSHKGGEAPPNTSALPQDRRGVVWTVCSSCLGWSFTQATSQLRLVRPICPSTCPFWDVPDFVGDFPICPVCLSWPIQTGRKACTYLHDSSFLLALTCPLAVLSSRQARTASTLATGEAAHVTLTWAWTPAASPTSLSCPRDLCSICQGRKSSINLNFLVRISCGHS